MAAACLHKAMWCGEAGRHLDERLHGCQAEAGGVSTGVLQLAHILHARMRLRCLAAEHVCLREQAQHLHSTPGIGSGLSRKIQSCVLYHGICLTSASCAELSVEVSLERQS